MIKLTKILLIVAVVLVIIIVLGAVIGRWTGWLAVNQPPLSSEAAYQKYFKNLALTRTNLLPTDDLALVWQVQPETADQQQLLVKILDLKKDIFVSESALMPLSGPTSLALTRPAAAGQFQAWVYLTVDNNQELLVAVLPFIVQ